MNRSQARADTFNLVEALLEIGSAITSVTRLTRSRMYRFLGIVFSFASTVSAVSYPFLAQ